MFTFKFDLESQIDRYNEVKDKIKNKDFYQKHNFYVLPFMPEKFRGRVVFFPEKFEPELIYKKQSLKIKKLEEDWENCKTEFIEKLSYYFPELNKIDVQIELSLYGTVGSLSIVDNKIFIYPRYDRKIISIKMLIINALTEYFFFRDNEEIEEDTVKWKNKQTKAFEIGQGMLNFKKPKSFVKILDTEFAGKLAEESAKYLEKLKSSSKFEVDKPENLTKSERDVMNLLLRNKNKLVTFDQIAEEIWREKQFEKYSEYAITTIIKKIKKKLKQKTDKHIIQAQRGVGYILHT
ncbi:MAG: helix-turn-helix domain-containing protein [Microgenomates group bacterium]